MVDLPWGDERTVQFVTNVGLITSDGPHGPNVMAAEWTHHVSYSPGLIAVCLGAGKATLDNIRATKEFGVNLASQGQNVLASVAGGSTGKEVDKVAALRELGFRFFKAKKISVPLVEGAALQAECRLVREVQLGDHTMLVGEVVAASHQPGTEPLAYHKGAYWLLTTQATKPSSEERERITSVVARHNKQTG